MSAPEESRSVISLRTAMILFATLAILCFVALKGTALLVGLLIVFALAVKAYLYHLRRRIQ